MAIEEPFKRFGHPSRFALELRLLPDPDPETEAPAASVGSWGQWKLWVRGVNLCEHLLALGLDEVLHQDAVTWYLAPLLHWFAKAWMPILHEERLPGPVRHARDARSAYLSMLSSRMDDRAVFGPWHDWASRHSLRWAAEGGLTPDVFLRRLGDDVEISWGDRGQPGGEAAEFHLEPGVAHAPVSEVAAALDQALAWAASTPALPMHPVRRGLRSAIKTRPTAREADRFLAWYLDGREEPGRQTELLRYAASTLGCEANLRMAAPVRTHAMDSMSPAVAMFGALSPRMSEAAAVALLGQMIAARDTSNASLAIDRHVKDYPAWRTPYPWEDGYVLARDLLDEMDAVPEASSLELDTLLDRLQVVRRQASLSEDGPLGVALAGQGVRPTIVVNVDHPTNRHEFGRRFTLAHELCHLLYDRDRAKRVSHSSTPWAPASVEQRANAFAAMLLMPPEVISRTFHRDARGVNLDGVRRAAMDMRVGLRAAIQHLSNLGEINEDDRLRLLDEVSESRGFRTF